MPILNRLPEDSLRTSDRIFAWLLILFGYVISMGVALDPSGWDDPVFTVIRAVPYSPYSWSAALAISVSVYTAGELISEVSKRRGTIVITGATLCASWTMAMSMAMARMVYVMPGRITILWPFAMFFVSCLYASRMIVYANTFTGERWRTDPYQLWATMFLMVASVAQVIIGVVPSSIFTEVERPVAFQLALINFMGGAVVMYGLHLRNKDLGLSIELSGAISLVATLAWYCAEVVRHNTLAGTTLGFALDEAFVFATFHRAVQIARLKRAQQGKDPELEDRLRQALNAPLQVDPIDESPKHGL